MRTYNKPPKTFDEQIQILENRGLVINDRARTKRHLSNVSQNPTMYLLVSRIISMTNWMPTNVLCSLNIIWAHTTILPHRQAGWVWNSCISASCQKYVRTSSQEKTEQISLPLSVLRMKLFSVPGSIHWITSGISVPTTPGYGISNLMSIQRNTSIRIRIISGWAMRKYRVHKREDYITACVWFFTCCRALTLIRNSENTLGNCLKIILLSNLDIWDSLKIGRSILCGRTKNSCIIQKWTLHLHSQSRKFLETRDNKPLRRVARQHTWGAFSIL